MMRLVRTDRPAVSGSAAEGGWRLGGVRCARLWVLACVVASLVAALPASARAADAVYWANEIGDTISFENLDGSGGGDLATTGATVDNPFGVALDPAAGRIYWANRLGDTISFANLDGSGGGDLTATGATVVGPSGVAVDRAAGRIYWANALGDTISFARLDGSGGGDLVTTGATLDFPAFPALLERPGGAGAPLVSGGSAVGATLSCSTGDWASDLAAPCSTAPRGASPMPGAATAPPSPARRRAR
jgi:hypothetical protein